MDGAPATPLRASWVWYEHLADADGQASWDTKMRRLGMTATAEDFWSYYSHVPPPSELFQRGVCVGRTVESLSVFRDGILPKWEDPVNERGGEWFARKSFAPGVLDALWELIVLAMVTETLEPNGGITGARVCDKSARGRPLYRLEVWYASGARAEDVRSALLKVLTNTPVHVRDGVSGPAERRKLAKYEVPKFELRSHEVQKAVELQKDLGLTPVWHPPPSAGQPQSGPPPASQSHAQSAPVAVPLGAQGAGPADAAAAR